MALIDHPVLENDTAEIWRRQCARNLMDCYALAMESSMTPEEKDGWKVFDGLARLMVEGLTAVKVKEDKEDEEAFYRMAAEQCRVCAAVCGGSERSRMFRIYAAIFEDMSR